MKGIPMTRHQAGRYAAKHPDGTQVPSAVAEAVADRLHDHAISCQAAHEIAQSLGVPPLKVGIAIDLQEGRIRECQLGLFGHAPDPPPARQALTVPPHLQASIKSAQVEKHLTCAKAWHIAKVHGMSRLLVGQACETLGIKISKCQLGAF